MARGSAAYFISKQRKAHTGGEKGRKGCRVGGWGWGTRAAITVPGQRWGGLPGGPRGGGPEGPQGLIPTARGYGPIRYHSNIMYMIFFWFIHVNPCFFPPTSKRLQHGWGLPCMPPALERGGWRKGPRRQEVVQAGDVLGAEGPRVPDAEVRDGPLDGCRARGRHPPHRSGGHGGECKGREGNVCGAGGGGGGGPGRRRVAVYHHEHRRAQEARTPGIKDRGEHRRHKGCENLMNGPEPPTNTTITPPRLSTTPPATPGDVVMGDRATGGGEAARHFIFTYQAK